MVDARTPVIVGGGQWSNRVDRGESPVEPVDLVTEAITRAADDSGTRQTRALLGAADAIWIVEMLSWRYPDPGALVAESIGLKSDDVDTARSPIGGNEPQSLVNQACRAIARGEAEVVLIGGAEAWRSRSDPGGKELGWTSDSRSDARRTGEEAPLSHPAELALQIYLPTQVYPLFEQAFRHRLGRSVDEHLVAVSELWARFSEIGADNPHAWMQEAMSAEQIRSPDDGNRWIGWPYTKVMNSNLAVEQGAGVIVASAEKARTLGVPRDRWVFPLASTEAHDHYAVSNRDDLASSPAIRLAGQKLRELSGIHPVETDHVDLYSCFPSAVEISATELGLPLDGSRDLTVTGGLSFAGGPWNNYVSHSLATMVGVLRENPGEVGLVTANGGYLTKHGLGLYSTEPPADGFRWASVQDEVDALPRREVLETDGSTGEGAGPTLPAELEAWTVLHDRDNRPEKVIAAVLLDDGRRAWGVSTDGAVLTELVSGQEQIGRKVEVAGAELRL